MKEPYEYWKDFEINYLRDHAPKSGANEKATIWLKLSEELNKKITNWCKKNPLVKGTSLSTERPRKPWERSAVAIADWYRKNYSKVHSTSEKPENLVQKAISYTKEDELSIYPPDLDLEIKKMVEDKAKWNDILSKCAELGKPNYDYVYGRVNRRYHFHLKNVSVEALENLAKHFVRPQNEPDRLVSQASNEESSSTNREVGGPLRTTGSRDSDTNRSKRTDERDNIEGSESIKDHRNPPVPSPSARSSSTSKREGKRPARETRLQDEPNKSLAPTGGSGNVQRRPEARTAAQSLRQDSRRRSREIKKPREPRKRDRSRDKYRERKDLELEEGEILELKRTDTGRSNSPDKRNERDSGQEMYATERRKKERMNVFGRR